MNFKLFAQQVKNNFDAMATKPLYRTNIGLDEIKDIYLAAFPKGSNPMYITNTQHDCTCCKSFIRNVGGLVNIVNGQIITIWDNVNTNEAMIARYSHSERSFYYPLRRPNSCYQNCMPFTGALPPHMRESK